MSQYFWMVLLVALGGATGGALRMGLSEHIAAGIRMRNTAIHFPWPTAAINFLGCFLFGALLGWLHSAPDLGPDLWLFVGVGLTGAMTTVSSFALEVVTLVRDRRFEVAGSYILTCVIGCPLCLFAGQSLTGAWSGAGP